MRTTSVPTEREDKDGFEDDDGCPDLDNDRDGVPDEKDKCPAQAEDRDEFEDGDGCPDDDNDKDGVADNSTTSAPTSPRRSTASKTTTVAPTRASRS